MEKVMGIDRRRPLPALRRARRFTDWFARRPAPARRAARRGGALPRHVRHLQHAGDRPRRGRAAGGGRLQGGAGRPQVLRTAADLQGHAGRGARARGVERGAARIPARRAAWPSWGSSPRACSRCATSTSTSCAPTRRARWRGRASLLEQFLLRERARGLTLSFKAGARDGAAARPLPPEGDRRHGAHGGRARSGPATR